MKLECEVCEIEEATDFVVHPNTGHRWWTCDNCWFNSPICMAVQATLNKIDE